MKKQKKAIITGGTGFIGSHLCKRLKDEGYWVRVIDKVPYQYGEHPADEVIILDLANDRTDTINAFKLDSGEAVDEVYHLCCMMGGAGFVFTGNNDALIISNSASSSINVAEACRELGIYKIFYSSSACIYPEQNQLTVDSPDCRENTAKPYNPDSVYGFEKAFGEELFSSYSRNHGISVKIARFHNIAGENGTWFGGKEKAPAAICRKVLVAKDGDEIEIWGDGKQTRSFLHVSECVEGIRRLMDSDFDGPVNIGSEECISINDMAKLVMTFENKNLIIKNIDGPTGVRGRNSDNTLIREKLQWEPNYSLEKCLRNVYFWIKEQLENE